MVFDGVLFSIIIGFLRKGSLRGIADLQLKFGWIFPILLVFQFIIFNFQESIELLGFLSGYLFIIVYIIGLFFLFINRHNYGFSFIIIGVLLNFIVMVLNGGRMPVSLEAASILDPMYADALINGLYGKHTVLMETTKLGFLGDIIPITSPYPRDQVISIGDIIMNIGIFLFIQHLMLPHKHLQSKVQL